MDGVFDPPSVFMQRWPTTISIRMYIKILDIITYI